MTKREVSDEVREILAKSGIHSFDTLVGRLAESISQTPHEDHLMAVGGLDAGRSTKAHQPPEMQVVLDGETNDPKVVREFDGQALYSTPGVNKKGEEVLYSFTTLEGLNEHVMAARFRHDIGTTNPDSLPSLSYYYEHDDAGGDWLQNGPGRAWPDLTRVRRGFLGAGNWNDVISSVNWCRWDISLYEHVGYGGSQLYLRAGRTYYHLSQFGWNDRASATVNWGRRF